MTRPQTIGQAQVKLILSLSTLSTHAMNERKQDCWHLYVKENNNGEGSQKGVKGLKSMRTIIGERKPNDRYDVRSRDCHAKSAHMSYGELSNGTCGGASNLLAQEDLELI